LVDSSDEDLCAGGPQPFQGGRGESPPKAPTLRPAPSSVSFDALPAFDMLPDAMKDVETLVDSSDEDEEALVDSGGEDSSMLLFGVDGCRKGTASTYLAATDIQRPGDGPGVANLCGCAAGAAANVSVWANKITVCG